MQGMSKKEIKKTSSIYEYEIWDENITKKEKRDMNLLIYQCFLLVLIPSLLLKNKKWEKMKCIAQMKNKKTWWWEIVIHTSIYKDIIQIIFKILQLL